MLDQIDKGEDFFGIEALTPAFHERMASIVEYLPGGALAVRRRARRLHRSARGRARRRQDLVPGAPRRAPAGLSARGLLLSTRRAARALRSRQARRGASARSRWHGRDSAGALSRCEQHRDLAIELQRARAEKHEELLRPLAKRLRDWRDEGVRTLIAVPNLQHAERLESLLKGYQIIPHLHRVVQPHDILDASCTTGERRDRARRARARLRAAARRRRRVISEQEIFGEKAARRAAKKPKRAFVEADFKHLEPGDFVVHKLHGVGIYKGLTKLPLRSGNEGGRGRLPAPRVRRRRALPAGLAPQRGAGRTPAPRASSPSSTSWAARPGRRRAPRSPRRCGSSPRSCCSSTRSGARCPATPSRSTAPIGDDVPRVRGDLPLRGDARSAEGDRRRARRSRSSSARWIAWSAATSATARPRWRCARRSRSCSAASRWRCWRRPPCSSSSTPSTSPRASRGCR